MHSWWGGPDFTRFNIPSCHLTPQSFFRYWISWRMYELIGTANLRSWQETTGNQARVKSLEIKTQQLLHSITGCLIWYLRWRGCHYYCTHRFVQCPMTKHKGRTNPITKHQLQCSCSYHPSATTKVMHLLYPTSHCNTHSSGHSGWRFSWRWRYSSNHFSTVHSLSSVSSSSPAGPPAGPQGCPNSTRFRSFVLSCLR